MQGITYKWPKPLNIMCVHVVMSTLYSSNLRPTALSLPLIFFKYHWYHGVTPL